MRKLGTRECWIGEGPVWNAAEGMLYFVDPAEKAVCRMNIETGDTEALPMPEAVASLAFDRTGCMIVSTARGVFRVGADGGFLPLYDPARHRIDRANDGKVGPDGRFYVGTQSSRRMGLSDAVDGRLYSIDAGGNVRILLEGLLLSNGMDWSPDGRFFYHTDSDTHMVREYAFAADAGDIVPTGREVRIPGVDGLTVDTEGILWAACWGQGHIARVDTRTLEVIGYLPVPCAIPASCAFAGDDMATLVAVTAYFDGPRDGLAGGIFACRPGAVGQRPHLFGEISSPSKEKI